MAAGKMLLKKALIVKIFVGTDSAKVLVVLTKTSQVQIGGKVGIGRISGLGTGVKLVHLLRGKLLVTV